MLALPVTISYGDDDYVEYCVLEKRITIAL
jgi:hypothetical protein